MVITKFMTVRTVALVCYSRRRERARKKKYECSKCLYDLPAFNQTFDPNEHNKFIQRREKFLLLDSQRKSVEDLMRDKIEHRYRDKLKTSFTWRRLLWELFLIGE